ncbi:hypothetical protein XF14_10785 [Burkholderia gladioli]|nr:hypothetical protein XF14_10785 [Burkholderia gladioli]
MSQQQFDALHIRTIVREDVQCGSHWPLIRIIDTREIGNQTCLRSAVQAFGVASHTGVERGIDEYLDESILTYALASRLSIFRIG